MALRSYPTIQLTEGECDIGVQPVVCAAIAVFERATPGKMTMHLDCKFDRSGVAVTQLNPKVFDLAVCVARRGIFVINDQDIER